MSRQMGSGTAHVTNGAATRWNVVRKNVGKVRKVKENVRYSSINDYTTSERALENTSLRNVLWDSQMARARCKSL